MLVLVCVLSAITKIYIIVLSIELLGTVFSVTLIYFKNNLCQAIFILFKCFKHVYYFFISKDFLVISVYYKCFAGLFYRNDVLISIVSVPKTIHIVMFFFFLPLRYPAAFIMKRLSSSHRKCYQLCYVYFSSLFALNQRPVIALFMYFFIKIPLHYCRRSRL